MGGSTPSALVPCLQLNSIHPIFSMASGSSTTFATKLLPADLLPRSREDRSRRSASKPPPACPPRRTPGTEDWPESGQNSGAPPVGNAKPPGRQGFRARPCSSYNRITERMLMSWLSRYFRRMRGRNEKPGDVKLQQLKERAGKGSP